MDLTRLTQEAIFLLKELISIPSFSREENDTADRIESFLREEGITVRRKLNNVWAANEHFSANLPTLLLNSHHDTVKPNNAWTLDPFQPSEKEDRLYGLGSNDAGGSLVSLLSAFRYLYHQKDLNFNLVFAATAEEENSGLNGIESILTDLGKIDFVLVGEPTGMEMAIAEKGLVVLECIAMGRAGHAARNTGENAITRAIRDIEWFHSFKFSKESSLLGPVRMTVTMIEAGIQHNIIPDICKFVVDVRSTDAYSNEKIVEIIRQHVKSKVTPRSTRLRPSKMEKNHPLVKAAVQCGIPLFGSPTTSDQAVIPHPSVKMGPGMSERSHTANEFIFLSEIRKGIEKYIQLLEKLNGTI